MKMLRAIKQAQKTKTDIPVGCVIERDGEVVGFGYNKREEDNDVTSHAEIVAIKMAEENLQRWRLEDCTMYVTLEPCPMCAWAILQSRIKTLYFGSYNTQCGAFGTVLDLKKVNNSSIQVYGGIEEEKCDKILDEFFKSIRK
jgi:tRNA(adenine34) deaminase